MSEMRRIAVAGAGSLGRPVIRALTDAGHPVTVLTRSHTPTKLALGVNADVQYATVDYKSVASLTAVLQNHLGVVSTLTATAGGEQGPLIEAAVAAGVSRFVPAEFGADMNNPQTHKLPVFQYKAMAEDQLISAAETHPDFSYTLVMNGAFLDWGLEKAFLLDPKNRAGTIFDSGDQKFSVTTIPSVATAVVGVFRNLEQTKNRAVYIHDATVTQNQLVEMVKQADPDHKEWDLKRASTEETEKEAYAVLGRDATQEDIGTAMVNFLYPSILREGYGGNFTGKTDNALLGLKEMSEAEIAAVVAKYL